MKKFYFIFLIIFVSAFLQAQDITPQQILQNMKNRVSDVKDYITDIEAKINMEGLKIPKIKIKMYYKAPDKYHYESKNFGILPKQGLNFNPFVFDEEKFIIKLENKETIDGKLFYVISAERKKEEKKKDDKKKDDKKKAKRTDYMEKTFIWVDSDQWVPKKIGNDPNSDNRFSVEFTHSLFEGKYLLPSKIDLKYDAPDAAASTDPADLKKQVEEGKKEKVFKGNRFMKGNKGSLSINFSNYVINKGISDDVFKKEE